MKMNYTQCSGLQSAPYMTTHVITNPKARRLMLIVFSLCVLTGLYQCIGCYLQTQRKVHQLEHELQTIGSDMLRIMHQMNAGRPSSSDAAAAAATNHQHAMMGHVTSGQVEDVMRRFTEKLHEEMLLNSRETRELRSELEALRAVAIAGEVGQLQRLPARMDYASESVGGSIHGIGNTVIASGFIKYYLGTRSPNAPIRIIQPTAAVGECFGFFGAEGEVVIRLQQRVFVEAVSVDHIDAKMSPSGSISSAPKRFNVYGMEMSSGRQHFFGSFEYKISIGRRLQTFEILEQMQSTVSFGLVQFRFMDNHGNAEYTCVYQTQVHGRADGSRMEH